MSKHHQNVSLHHHHRTTKPVSPATQANSLRKNGLSTVDEFITKQQSNHQRTEPTNNISMDLIALKQLDHVPKQKTHPIIIKNATLKRTRDGSHVLTLKPSTRLPNDQSLLFTPKKTPSLVITPKSNRATIATSTHLSNTDSPLHHVKSYSSAMSLNETNDGLSMMPFTVYDRSVAGTEDRQWYNRLNTSNLPSNPNEMITTRIDEQQKCI